MITFKEAKDWKVIGKPTKRLDTPEKILGRARFGMDVQFELDDDRDGRAGAGVRRHGPSFEGAGALAVPGVHKVVQVPTGVAVIAEHYWAAKLGRDALKVDWDMGPNADLSSQGLLDSFRKLAATPGHVGRSGRGRQGQLRKSGEENRRRVQRAVSGPRADGAAQLHGEDQRRKV